MPSVSRILSLAEVGCYLAANDIDKGNVFGKKLDERLPTTIYMVYKVLKKIYDNGGTAQSEVRATGLITIADIGNDGDEIEVSVIDPIYGLISLGTYEKQNTDTDSSVLASSIIAEMNNNTYGYLFSSVGNVISIIARSGIGSLVNGLSNISVVITAARIFDNSFDVTFN